LEVSAKRFNLNVSTRLCHIAEQSAQQIFNVTDAQSKPDIEPDRDRPRQSIGRGWMAITIDLIIHGDVESKKTRVRSTMLLRHPER
jgi:hypothetical protein